MRNSTTPARLLGLISVVSLLYCLFAYIRLQSALTVGGAQTENVKILGIFILPALAMVGIYHLMLLIGALKTASGKFVDSVMITLVALSGITLFSDVTFLSDIGKEYLYWDVTGEWNILYGFTAFHMIVVVWGLLRGGTAGAYTSSAKNDRFFLSMHRIGLLSGLLGLGGVMMANTGLIVPPRYAAQIAILLAGLALFPLALFLFYCINKLRHISLREWLDEKQLNDTAFGALMSIVLSVPLYGLICVFDVIHITLPASSLVLGLFFIQLSILSLALIIRNKTGEG
jgi:hypothetical protein